MKTSYNRDWTNQLDKEDAELIAYALYAATQSKRALSLANKLVREHKLDPKIKIPSEYTGSEQSY